VSSDLSDLDARLGLAASRALHEHLSSTKTLPASGGATFALEVIREPYFFNGHWNLELDVILPKDEGHMLFAVSQSGSSYDPEKLTLPLPPKDFSDEAPNASPERRKAFSELVEIVKRELERGGFTQGDGADFQIDDDLGAGENLFVAVRNPRMFERKLARTLQKELRRGDATFSVYLSLFSEDPAYRGRDEALVIRADRIVEDWNAQRLRTEFPGQFNWEAS
jgi:hypothetical protein